MSSYHAAAELQKCLSPPETGNMNEEQNTLLQSELIWRLQGHSSGHTGNGETLRIFQVMPRPPFVKRWKDQQRDAWVLYESLLDRNVQNFSLCQETEEDTVRPSWRKQLFRAASERLLTLGLNRQALSLSGDGQCLWLHYSAGTRNQMRWDVLLIRINSNTNTLLVWLVSWQTVKHACSHKLCTQYWQILI